MPELPEVETYVRDLARVLPGRVFKGAHSDWPAQLPLNSESELDRRISNQEVVGVSRRAKFIVLRLSSDWLLIHLKMSGRLILAPPGTEADPYAHTVFALDGGDELRFRNPRKFGRVYLVSEPEGLLGSLGPEPLDDAFTPQVFEDLIARRRGRLKPLLLDQRFVAGLGNIYVDESLWAARLHPLRTADTLGSGEVLRLHGAIREVLALAVSLRGTSLTEGGYRDLTGNPGEMWGSLAVYGRTAEPCPRCSAAIERLVVGGRGTHVCPCCQEMPDR